MFSFKRDAKLYLVSNSFRYRIDISDISFSQNIEEKETPKKTIQGQEMFPRKRALKFSPAVFSFTMPAIREADLTQVLDNGLEMRVFKLYISTEEDVFELDKCFITNVSFIFDKLKPLGLSFEGEASRLSRVGDPWSYTIPGTPVARSSTRTYNRLNRVDITLDGNTLDGVSIVRAELQNNIEWKPNKVLEDICPFTGNTLIYPEEFSIVDRIFSGNVTSYDLTSTLYSTDAPMYLIAGENVMGTTYGIEFNLPGVSFTTRVNTGEVFTKSYDWRLVRNPTNLSEWVTYIVDYAESTNAILDENGLDLLDENGLPLLDNN